MQINNTANYWCEFKLRGGNGATIRVPYTEIRYITIDPEGLQSKLLIRGKDAPISISNTPEEIQAQTRQKIL